MNSKAFNVGVGNELQKVGFMPFLQAASGYSAFNAGKQLAKPVLDKADQFVADKLDLKGAQGVIEKYAPATTARFKQQVGDIATDAVTGKLKEFGQKALPWAIGGLGAAGLIGGLLMGRRKQQQQPQMVVNNFQGPAQQSRSMSFDKPGISG